MIKEVEHFKISIDSNNETIAERNRSFIHCFKGNIEYVTTICKSKNTESDKYNKEIGIVVAILKTLGFSRRIISQITNILLEKRKCHAICQA